MLYQNALYSFNKKKIAVGFKRVELSNASKSSLFVMPFMKYI